VCLAGWCVPGWCVPGWCPGWKWLPACLEPRALLVRVCSCLLVGVLVGSGYLHALNLVPAGSCVFVCPCGWCWLEVVTCMP